MTERTLTTARSLHARPASQLAKAAAAYACDITIHARGKQANAKSVLSLMTLGVGAGTDVAVRAEGPDDEAALDAIAGQLATPEATESKGA